MYPMHLKFAVTGVSGAGKTTLLNLLKEISHNVTLHVKDTTRQRRSGESEGNSLDLAFITKEEFENNKRNGAYELIYPRYDCLYGVRRDQILRAVQQKEAHFIIISDIPSIGQFKYMYRDARAIYVHTDPRDIPKHLQKREGVDHKERLNRVEQAYTEFVEHNTLFDHVVLNFWEKENAVRQLRNILHAYARNAATDLP